MGYVSTNEFKGGLKIMMDGDPYNIMENEFVKPGKGQAFNRVKLRNLRTGRILERTLKSGETFETADVVDMDLQYLYDDGQTLHFMSPESYEQYAINRELAPEVTKWLKGQEQCIGTIYNGALITVTPPVFVNLKVADTDPGLRGDTATGGSKLATMETGTAVKVPLFINIGETLKIDTRTGEYMARAKEE